MRKKISRQLIYLMLKLFQFLIHMAMLQIQKYLKRNKLRHFQL